MNSHRQPQQDLLRCKRPPRIIRLGGTMNVLVDRRQSRVGEYSHTPRTYGRAPFEGLKMAMEKTHEEPKLRPKTSIAISQR